MTSLYEILVPTTDNNGKPFRARYHRVWDAKIRALTGGLTVMQPTVKGEWVDEDSEILYSERMIPVRIMTDEETMHEILSLTLRYYKQKAIFHFKLSDDAGIYTE